MARSPEVENAIMAHPALKMGRDRVFDAGCEVPPSELKNYDLSPQPPPPTNKEPPPSKLNVRFLDGTCRSIELGPDKTIADLRAELERHVPPMHGIKLVQDLQELKDTDQINGEVQAITVSMS